MSRRVQLTSGLLLTLGFASALSIGLGVANADTETDSGATHSASKSPPAHRSTAGNEKPRAARAVAASSRSPTPVAARRAAPTRVVALPPAAPDTTPNPIPIALAGVSSVVGSAPLPRSATSQVATQSAVTTAAVPPVTVEAETMVLNPARAGRSYADATASGGSALLMSTNGAASTTVTLPDFTGLVIRAKGDQYRGAPTMTVSVDGKVVSTTSVSATSWTDYAVALTGAAGTHTLTIGYTNDYTSTRGRDRNLRIDTITVVAAAAPVNPPPVFTAADWLNTPITGNPALAANSATWVGYFADPRTQRIADLNQYGVALVPGTAVTASTPRYNVTFTQPWGADPFGNYLVPIPTGTTVPTGTDAPLAVQDPVSGQVFGLWQARYDSTSDTWTASWGGMTPIAGNGIDTSGSATATSISRYAGVVTGAELTAAVAANTGLSHALVFSTDIAGPDFVGPATKSDGANIAGVALPIPEGYRVQLDPTINVDAIAGMTPGEKVIAKTLQTYGAYVVDQGGARMAFAFQMLPDATAANPGKAYTDAGFAWDYFDMASIPWSSLRVLAV